MTATPQSHAGRAWIMASALAAMSLAGCASFSPDAGMDVVSGVAGTALRQDSHKIDTDEAAAAAQERVRRLLAAPLSAGAAIQVALLNNKGLQAAYNELGVAEAVRVEASLPPNPTFSISRISTSVELDIERQVVADILALAMLPARTEIARDRFRQAQLNAAQETLRVAVEARRNYYRAVASRQLVAFLGQASTAAETAAKLAAELGRTGAMNMLDQAREQSFYVELSAQLATAQQDAASDREALIRSLGLWGGDLGFKLPEALPTLPKRPKSLPAIEVRAVHQRVDLQIARIEVDALAKSYGLTSATRFINLLDVAGISRTQREPSGPHGTGGGVDVAFQVPIFDFGEVRLRQAAESYMAAVNRLIEKAVNMRSEARDAYRVYRSTYDIAAYYRDRVLPVRQLITDETMLRYGAMQIDVFSLLTEARQRVTVNIASITAQRNFWVASANLDAAVIGAAQRAMAARRRVSLPDQASRRRLNELRRIDMLSRRNLLGAGAALAGAGLISGPVQPANIPEAPTTATNSMQPPLFPSNGPEYQPVVTLNGWTLPWRMNGEWKEFHLVAEPVVREFAPGMKAYLWGYNGQSPGPTIEAAEGDKVRIFVTNKLPEHTTVHWHGMLVPNGMDGVGGVTQPHIDPGKTFVYEFELKRSGSFMYHPHSDEMVQMAMGMMGMFIVHPRDPKLHRVDRDFVFVMSSYLIDPGTYLPKVAEMTDFNMWTWNARVFPGIDPLPVRLGDRVRVRIGNLTMTNHPIHLHGHSFTVTGTDGGWIPESARWPETTTDVPVGAIHAFEVIADAPGDWAFHCHKSHHTMNAMGHNTRNLIGVNQKELAKARRIIPDFHPMGAGGMADMGSMEMPMPDNTLPMMTGFGQFGPIEMGGMFTVMKVREDLDENDYADPGPYKNPEGSVAHEVTITTDQPIPRPEGGPSTGARPRTANERVIRTTSKSRR